MYLGFVGTRDLISEGMHERGDIGSSGLALKMPS